MAFNNATLAQVTEMIFQNVTTEPALLANQSNASVENKFLDEETSVDISEETADNFEFAIECVLVPILVGFGITGNVLSLIVLCQRRLRASSTTVLLIGLAISDCLYLATTMIRKSTCIIGRFNEITSYRFFVLSFSSMYYINTCFSRVSTLLVAVMSVERLIAVTLPLKVKLLCTKTKMAITVVSCFVFTFAFLALLTTQFEVKTIRNTPVLLYSDFYKNNKDFLDIYNEYITVSVLRWLPKVIVVTCNTVIITFLWKRYIPSENFENTSSLSSYQRTQRRITTMLVTVAVVFVLTLLPGDAFWIASVVVDEFKLSGKYNNLFLVLSDVIVTFEIINSSINFVIYMLLNSTFSNVYLTLFCLCLPKAKRLRLAESTKRYGLGYNSSTCPKKGKENEAYISDADVSYPPPEFESD